MRVDEVAIGEFLHTSYPRLVAAVALCGASRIGHRRLVPAGS
jgi:hypothetical protein